MATSGHALSCFIALASLAVTAPGATQIPVVEDVALTSGFQDLWFGHHNRGRALVAADFDLDGRVDFFVGNPSDESFILRNVSERPGEAAFELGPILLTSHFAWGAAAADYDNDGDYDLFVSVGGNEGIGFDHLFQNRWFEDGRTSLTFVNVTGTAGVGGPLWNPTMAVDIASANGVWSDYDLDGDVDLFVNGHMYPSSWPMFIGENHLWRNEGDGTFHRVTADVGLVGPMAETQNSTFLDIDNDGDFDLFECNDRRRNVLWRNLLTESGVAEFEDVTAEFSPAGQDLGYPEQCFASAAGDFDNDGWEDLIVFKRGVGLEDGSPYPAGHALFINQRGAGFENIADAAGLNRAYQEVNGVMGCQIGDIDGDGVLDVFFGNGGPPSGESNQLFLSDSAVGAPPHYVDRSHLIDVPAPQEPGVPYPPFPYRTHGSAIVDVDGDGQPELAIVNGGRAVEPDRVQEPNRLFRFEYDPKPTFLRVRPVGNGTSVSRDAIGTRLALTIRRGSGPPRTVHRTLFAGSAFSAQNGFEVYFGLGDADSIDALTIVWPDGHRDVISADIPIGGSIVVQREPEAGSTGSTLMLTKRPGAQLELTWGASCSPSDDDYVVYEGDMENFLEYESRLCSTDGRRTATLSEAAGDAFFRVAPRSLQAEGAHGTAFPTIVTTCLPQVIGCAD